ncbi:DnaD domain-containing protein [Clostridium sp.]|uniref:DnaD domain-containing protein n=1 Tax=Clostridium sp. TaxID=1506 RepID=UPI003D6CC46E
MAKYRQLHTEFWSDSFVLELTPEEKYFYLYLMTNTKTTQCGVYEISKRTIETDCGYNRETVEKLIKRFCDYKKILYCDDTKELMIINWIKYNLPNSQNVIKCVQNELLKVKNSEFVKILFDKCQGAGLDVEKIFENHIIGEIFDSSSAKDRAALKFSTKKVDKPSIEYALEKNTEEILAIDKACEEILKKIETVKPDTIYYDVEDERIQETSEVQINKPLSRDLEGACKVLGSNKEEVISNKQEVINKKEEEEEVINKKETFINNNLATATEDESFKNLIKVFDENIHVISPLEYEKILEFTKHVSSEVILMAIEEAVIYNAKTLQYISKIINSWISQGIKTTEGVKAYQKKWSNKKINSVSHNIKKGGFCDFEQRNYDYEALEKKLLGHLDAEDLD